MAYNFTPFPVTIAVGQTSVDCGGNTPRMTLVGMYIASALTGTAISFGMAIPTIAHETGDSTFVPAQDNEGNAINATGITGLCYVALPPANFPTAYRLQLTSNVQQATAACSIILIFRNFD